MAGLSTAVQKDVSEYKSKIVGKLSARALVTIACAIGSSVGLALWLWFVLGVDPTDFGFFIMLVAVPSWLFGFYKPDGMDFEKWLPRWFEHRFGKSYLTYQSFQRKSGIYKSVAADEEKCIDVSKIKGHEAYEAKEKE